MHKFRKYQFWQLLQKLIKLYNTTVYFQKRFQYQPILQKVTNQTKISAQIFKKIRNFWPILQIDKCTAKFHIFRMVNEINQD